VKHLRNILLEVQPIFLVGNSACVHNIEENYIHVRKTFLSPNFDMYNYKICSVIKLNVHGLCILVGGAPAPTGT
jgi:hypothetical protein